MAGLNSLVADTTSQTTALPSWYDTAQQNLTSQAQTAAGQVPSFAQTPVAGVAEKMSGGASPFGQAQNTLNQIATGAANPWITDASGKVSPNTATPLGGLFQAQNQQLQQLMPNIQAPAGAAGIGSGQFGSLRGQTAVDKAMGDAATKLYADQMQSALNAQQVGSQAASALGNVGQQEAQSAIATGTFQQNAPLQALTDLANIINAQRTGSTVSKTTQYSPLSLGTGLITALGGTSGNAGILGQLFGSTTKNAAGQSVNVPGLLGSGGIGNIFKGIFSSGSTAVDQATPGTYPLADGGTYVVRPDGSSYITDSSGSMTNFDASGQVIDNRDVGDTSGGGGGSSEVIGGDTNTDTGGGSTDTGGGLDYTDDTDYSI